MKHYLHNSLRALLLSLAVFLSLPMLAAKIQINGIRYNIDESSNTAVVIAKLVGKYSGEVVIPDSVEYKGTFYCVTSIGTSAFADCSGLTLVAIGNSVTNIGDKAFYECTGLTSVIIGNSVTDIGNKAFYGCHGVSSVTIPNSVTSIGISTFEGCSGLTSVTIPNGVTSIGNKAFCGCWSVTSVTIPTSVTSIGELAFERCSNVTSIAIPNGVAKIGEGAFADCSSLSSIIVEEGNPFFDSRNNCNAIIETSTNTLHSGCQTTIIPNSVENIGNKAFYGCINLTSVTIPNSVTSIGYKAFEACHKLTSVTIPNSVTDIRDSAFENCTALTSVTIGNNVTKIWEHAFWYCPELRDVYCYAETVPSTGIDIFGNSPIQKVTLHVPAASIDNYKATEPWRSFGNIVALTDEETGIENIDANAENSVIYDLSGRRVQNAQKGGIYIINGKKVIVK